MVIVMITTTPLHPHCHLYFNSKELRAVKGAEGWLNPAPHNVALTYIFPACSSRAQSKVTSQLPDVKKRGGTEGMAGCVTQRNRDEEEVEAGRYTVQNKNRWGDTASVCQRMEGEKNEDRLKPNENSDIFLLLLLFIVTLGAKLMRDTNNFATNDLYEPEGVGKKALLNTKFT